MSSSVLWWVRDDRRLADNPALSDALAREGAVIAVFVHETDPELRPIGAATRWWLHHSLNCLEADLAGLGVPLLVESGPAAETLSRLAAQHGAERLVFNRRYGPAQRLVDERVRRRLEQAGSAVADFPGSLLTEPLDLQTKAGTPFSVFAPFFKALQAKGVAQPLPAPRRGGSPLTPRGVDKGYKQPGWSLKFSPLWMVGEKAAQASLQRFINSGLKTYAKGRDFPGRDATSRLSPHLRHGEISPRQLWHAALAVEAREADHASKAGKLLSELSWRDFNYHQLYHRPDIAKEPMQPRLPGITYRRDAEAFQRWTSGQTGIPIIDAGMRELWETGWMQNRVRMLTASFMVKNLLADWRLGEAWFWDTLVDADPANNAGNWQWIAGTGFDAAPFFRIFNPVTQGERFDAEGAYVRRFIPELAMLPDAFVHRPIEAPAHVLTAASVMLGKTYPLPLVDLSASRQAALEALRSARAARDRGAGQLSLDETGRDR